VYIMYCLLFPPFPQFHWSFFHKEEDTGKDFGIIKASFRTTRSASVHKILISKWQWFFPELELPIYLTILLSYFANWNLKVCEIENSINDEKSCKEYTTTTFYARLFETRLIDETIFHLLGSFSVYFSLFWNALL